MLIRKLETWQEWVEAEAIRATAFLHKFDRTESEKNQQERFGKETADKQTVWGAFNENGVLSSAIDTSLHSLVFDGQVVLSGEANTVATLPEARGQGIVRAMFTRVFEDFIENGCVFAELHPFSFAFYRKFGFELSTSPVRQVFSIDQLAGFACELNVRRVASQGDADDMKALWHDFALARNLLRIPAEKDWHYRGEGEVGEPSWWDGDRTKYTYLFSDGNGAPRGFLEFMFEDKPHEMIGRMEIRRFVYDGPSTFRSMLGFIYGLRAKCVEVSVELRDEIDLADILPECGKVRRTRESGSMFRVLDAKRAIELARHPAESGEYTMEVADKFFPANSGVYRVMFADGKASVQRVETQPDLRVSVETLGQMLTGHIDLYSACFREGTEVFGNEKTLRRVFVKKTVCSM